VAVAENPAETVAPDVNLSCQSRVLLMRPSESGRRASIKLLPGPLTQQGWGPARAGRRAPIKLLPGPMGPGKERGAGLGGTGFSQQPNGAL
jgi:hypothetical protein